jgi:flagellar biosynthesis/type III secretory pathway protein FliH
MELSTMSIYVNIEENEILREIRDTGMEIGLRKGREQGREQGREEGKEQGMLLLLRDQLEERFGKLPPWAMRRLETAGQAQLSPWARRVLGAGSLEDVIGGNTEPSRDQI